VVFSLFISVLPLGGRVQGDLFPSIRLARGVCLELGALVPSGAESRGKIGDEGGPRGGSCIYHFDGYLRRAFLRHDV
jgi:hypothetical protein